MRLFGTEKSAVSRERKTGEERLSPHSHTRSFFISRLPTQRKHQTFFPRPDRFFFWFRCDEQRGSVEHLRFRCFVGKIEGSITQKKTLPAAVRPVASVTERRDGDFRNFKIAVARIFRVLQGRQKRNHWAFSQKTIHVTKGSRQETKRGKRTEEFS